MDDIKNKYIDNATYVVSFQRYEKMRLRQADVEKTFGSMFPNVQSISTNLPDDYGPDAPRFIIQTAKKTLTVSQVATQLTLNFESNSKPLQEQLGIIEKNINSYVLAVKEFIEENYTEQQGFIISLNYRTKQTQQEMSDYLFKRFFSLKPYGEPVSTNFKIGFRTSDFLFVNFEVSSYEIREAKIEQGKTKILKVDTIPVKETGYNLKVDINNRPMFMADNKSLPLITSSETIKKQMRNTIENEIDNFMGFAN
jgi:hypothetical protein